MESPVLASPKVDSLHRSVQKLVRTRRLLAVGLSVAAVLIIGSADVTADATQSNRTS